MLLTLPPSFRNLLGHLQSIVFMVYNDSDDGEYYFQFCEGKDAVRMGIHTRMVSGCPLSQLFDASNYAMIQDSFSALLRFGGTCSFELQLGASHFLVHASFVDTEHGSGDIIGNMVDITMIKHAEEELRRALQEEKHVVAMKTQFLNTVSHEFRTPLTGIQLSASMLQRYSSRMNDGERELAVSHINKRIRELTALMDMLLLQSSTKSLKELFTPIELDLSQLVYSVVADFEETMDCDGHTILITASNALRANGDVQSCGDHRLLTYALRNILGNAVKYSPGKNRVDVLLEYEPPEFIIRIRDYGIGMSDHDRERIFTQFFRSENVGNISGTGLGLNIAHEFIQIHNGRIDVESETGKGSTFSIRLPIQHHTASNLIHNPQYRVTIPQYE
ncbi:MAG: HAMP domain-containing histidine kinase [Candidatus Kapabacteria bacterium]|nr:HAMP domain-containing histidine kinase [Candidatus Kapabacteria bacterium]